MENKSLKELPNLGKSIISQLLEIGIESPSELKSQGAENTFIKIYSIDNSSCINKLYAIEGAIQGIRWHNLDPNRKTELLSFYKKLKMDLETKNI